MSYAVRATESVSVVATIQTVNGVGSWYSDAIDISKYRRFVAYINEGTIGSSSTVDFGFQGSATSGGSYATTGLTTSAITQDTAGSILNVVEVATEQVYNAAPTVAYLKGYLKIAVAATPTSVTILGFEPRYAPISNEAAKASPTDADAQIITAQA